jgi:hypothetical protein
MPWTRQVSYSMTYSIGDEISSSNYRPSYCNQCDADTPEQCTCDQQQYDYVVCKECGHDHCYRPNFSGVQTSIDIIPKLQGTQPEENYNNSLLAKAAEQGASEQ